MQKMIPDIPQPIIDVLPNAFEVSASQIISKQEFELLINDQEQNISGSMNAKKMQNKIRIAKAKPTKESQAILKFMAEAAKADDLKFEDFFILADPSFIGTCKVPDLKNVIK